MVDLKGKPFYLKDADIAWVETTLQKMTDKEKLSQLFVLECINGDFDTIKADLDKAEPGGIMLRPNETKKLQELTQKLQVEAKIPLLIAANVCHGFRDVATDKRNYLTNMGVGACHDSMYAYRQGIICGEGSNNVGVNWTFAPVTDLNLNYMNSVIGTRSYGDDVKLVGEMSAAYIRGVQETGVASTFKHFPGDGVDFRDQHVTPSVNSLTCEEWDQTFGKVYEKAIDAGALTCMVGHIAMPAWSMRINPELSYGECLPGTLSKELLQGLLRERLGFNGMIVTDATHMGGMAAVLPRRESVPLAIEAGCDMFLFYANYDEDFFFMEEGLKNGLLSHERLDEAVTRILAVKAALGLHQETSRKTVPEEREQIFSQWTKEAMEKSITLVKNLRPDVFPITPERYPRILLYSHVSDHVMPHGLRPGMKPNKPVDKQALFNYFRQRLEKLGFDITVYDEQLGDTQKISAYYSKESVKQYDMALHFANGQNENGRAEWLFYHGHCADDAPYTDMYIPTVLISMNSPYIIADAPRVKTVINCYTNTEEAVDALIEKLLGKTEFQGVSPVDAFCGLEDARW